MQRRRGFDSFEARNTLTLGFVALTAPEQELNIHIDAAIGVLSLRRAPKLGKLLVCIASIYSSCDLRPPPNRKGLSPPVPWVFVDQFPRQIDKVASSWTLRGWSPPCTRATVTLRGLKSPSMWTYDSTTYRNHAKYFRVYIVFAFSKPFPLPSYAMFYFPLQHLELHV